MRSTKTIQLLALPIFACALLGMSGMNLLDEPFDTPVVVDHMKKTLHDFTVETLSGDIFDMSSLAGKKVLIVNTASECGLTPQYEQLQELYDEFGGDTFEIIGFPSNDFAGQEPGSNDDIAAFCQKNYGVTFPMMTKVAVKGDEIHPVYQWLTQKSMNGLADHEVKWNFHKFLVDEKGNLVKEVHPQTLPTDEVILNWLQE